MRIIHTSDLHFGRSLCEYSLLEDQRHFSRWMLKTLRETQADALIIAGDIYNHAAPSGEAVTLLDDFLYSIVEELKIPVLAVSGNHDSGQRLTFANRLYASAGLHIAALPAKQIHTVTLTDSFGPVHFHLLPFLHPSQVKSLFDDPSITTYELAYQRMLSENRTALNTDERNILVAHGFFSPLSGSESDCAMITSDSEVSIGTHDIVSTRYFEPFDYVALGHLHAPQQAGKSTIRYSGSPLKYSISESAHKKLVTLIELGEKGTIHLETIPVAPLRDVRIIKGTFEQAIDPLTHVKTNLNDYVYLDLSNDTPVLYAMEKLRHLFPNILGLRFHLNEQQNPALQSASDLKSRDIRFLFEQYYLQIKGHEMDADRKQVMESIYRELEQETLQDGGASCVQSN